MRKQGFKFTIVALILLVVFVMSTLVITAATPTGTRLKDIQSRVLIGTCTMNGFQTMSDAATYTATAIAEFNMLTPENAMKWDATEPNQNQFNFTEGDKHVAWGQTNGMKIHGHTLVWHSQLPGWVNNISTASALTSAMNNHIDKVMAQWKGKIAVWDVVNEAFEENGTYRNSVFYRLLGKAFIEQAFIRARAADPAAKLIYNDYNLEYTGAKSNAAYELLRDLKSRNIPVDGIGFQMHLDIQYGFDYNDFASNMQRFVDLGLEVYVTEMDVRISSGSPAAELQTQANYYEGVVQKLMAQPAVKAIQVWGVTDKYSWVPQTFPGRDSALLFDSNYNAKPAYYAVQRALGGTSNTPTPTRRVATPTPTQVRITPTPTRRRPIPSTITPTPTRRGSTPTPTRRVANTPTPTQGTGGGYVVTYTIQSDWGNGATIGVTIKNNSTAAVNGWTLAFTFPGNQTITNLWNGTYTQSGANVSVKDAGYNANIPANGGSVNFGFNLNYSGTNAKPTAFTLNGTACTVQ